MKCALAGAGGDETLVFDEIDAGIGGRTAVAVAQKLRELAGPVTGGRGHPSGPGGRAGRPATTSSRRRSDGAGTVTRLSRLEGEAVVEELCRMMGGSPDDAEAMAHARDLREGIEGLRNETRSSRLLGLLD